MDHYRDPSGTESCNVQKPRLQVHIHGQWMLPSLMHSFVGQSSIRELCPPALLLLEGERTEGRKKREVLHLFRCYTHTHTRPEPGQPWKAKERKKRTQTTGKGPKQRRGEGNRRTSKTNLHGETDLTKTEHTPKPPRHITERHAERIRDQMGN